MNDHDDDRAGRDPDPAAGAGGGGPDARGDLADAEQDLKATAEAIRLDIGRLATIEDQKLVLDPGDPRVDIASEEAVRLADRIAREARAERQLSHEID